MGEYDKDYMKIKFNSTDDFPLNKQLNFLSLTAFIRNTLEKDGKYCPQFFLDDCLYCLIDCSENLHDDDIIRPVCIILTQMSGHIKYFDNGGKNMSFKIENESVYLKYTEL